ncbi:MAG: hypothetical protein K2K10_13505 [Acetatifactor sp.]|nr:hypothetical protein [Acetatifactor sp.]
MNGVTLGTTALAGALVKAEKLCKVADTALRVAMVSERIGGALTFAQNFYNIGQTGIQMYCKYGIMGESMGLDTVGEVLGIGLSAMGCASGLYSMGHTSKGLLELQEKVEAGMLCFVAGTKVKTPDGDRNIEVGDEVWSCDVETGETGCKRVTRLSVSEFSDIAHVTIDGETIDATTTHPFYVEEYGFKPAGQLLAGEKVRLLDGGTGEVEAVTVEHLDEPVKVYNFEVEDWHTYYVAELGVLVHNKGCGTTTGNRPPNLSPEGAGRNGAYREAKRKNNIPMSEQPKVTPNIDKRGNRQPGKTYEFENGIKIRDDAKGHKYRDNPTQNRGPHFNDPDGNHFDY